MKKIMTIIWLGLIGLGFIGCDHLVDRFMDDSDTYAEIKGFNKGYKTAMAMQQEKDHTSNDFMLIYRGVEVDRGVRDFMLEMTKFEK